MKQIMVGKVLKPQGIKGEVKVKPIVDNIERFKNFNKFFIGKTNIEYKVNKLDIRFGYIYITFDGILSRNDAELLRNKQLFVCSEDFGEIAQDSYLLEDLIGLNVVYEGTKNCAGKIIDIEQYGSADVIDILSIEGREYQVPFLKTIFNKVDISNGVIYVNKDAYEEIRL